MKQNGEGGLKGQPLSCDGSHIPLSIRLEFKVVSGGALLAHVSSIDDPQPRNNRWKEQVALRPQNVNICSK